jgi:hypothetical protein
MIPLKSLSVVVAKVVIAAAGLLAVMAALVQLIWAAVPVVEVATAATADPAVAAEQQP